MSTSPNMATSHDGSTSMNPYPPRPTHLADFLPTPYEVLAKKREAADVVTLKIRPAHGGAPPPCAPGQFNMLHVHGCGDIPVSISGTSADGAWLHTIRAVGAVSQALCRLPKGATLGVRGPYGQPWPLPTLAGKSVLVVAGGLGLAPLRPAIEALVRGLAPGKRLGIYCGARSPADLLFASTIERWRRAARRMAIDLRLTVDHLPNGLTRPWTGDVGVVTSLLPRSLPEPEQTAALLCGPEVMMRHASTDLLRLGLSPEAIYLSLERNMRCAIGLCGHCQLQSFFICRDGPVLPLAKVRQLLTVKEL